LSAARKAARASLNHGYANNPFIERAKDHVPNLGLGLIDWDSHCKAIRVHWILNYLNASQGSWKTVLDAWLARPDMGRASICTSTNSSQLLAALDGSNRPSIPSFWRAAVKEFRANKFNRVSDHESNHRSQPLWTNPHTQPPKIYHGYKKLWIKFGTFTVDNIINGSEFYTEDENDQNIRPYLTEEDGTHFKIDGKKLDRYKFLASYKKIKTHVTEAYANNITYEPWPGYKLMADKMCRWYDYDPRDIPGLGTMGQGRKEPLNHTNQPEKKTKAEPNAAHHPTCASTWKGTDTTFSPKTKYTTPRSTS
jgi:hypothetical protein